MFAVLSFCEEFATPRALILLLMQLSSNASHRSDKILLSWDTVCSSVRCVARHMWLMQHLGAFTSMLCQEYICAAWFQWHWDRWV